MEIINEEIINDTDSVNEELRRVKAELAEIKQRFGLDKQEAFWKLTLI